MRIPRFTPVQYGVAISVALVVLVLGYYLYVHGISFKSENAPITATTTEEAPFVPALAIDACGKEIAVDTACVAQVGKGRGVVLRSSPSELRVEEPGTGKRIQSIPREENVYNLPVSLEHDIDFDGYLDLEVGEGSGVLDNIVSSYWTFYPVTGGFQKHLVFNGLSNLEFDSATKEMTSTSRCCAGGGFYRGVYTFLDGEYVLTYAFEHTETGGEGFDTPMDTERRLINGEMVETTKEVESWFTE